MRGEMVIMLEADVAKRGRVGGTGRRAWLRTMCAYKHLGVRLSYPAPSRTIQGLAVIPSTYGTVAEVTDVSGFCSGSFFLSGSIRKRNLFGMWQTFVAARVCRFCNTASLVAR